MKPTFTRLALLTATCGVICSCSTRQRVDYNWFRDTMVAAQDDQVTVEEGSGMTAAEAAAETAAPAPTPAAPVVTATPTPQPVATPTAPAVAARPATQPANTNKKGSGSWFSQQQTAPCSATKATASTYTVRSGDTLSVIARRHGVSMAALAQANNLANPNALRIGQVLTIPSTAGRAAAAAPVINTPAAAAKPTAPAATPAATTTAAGYYTVAKGDTLSGIARRHGTTIEKIMQANRMTAAQAHKLSIGQKIIIPNN